jgi:hypothetical protein
MGLPLDPAKHSKAYGLDLLPALSKKRRPIDFYGFPKKTWWIQIFLIDIFF